MVMDKIHVDRMQAAAAEGFMNATDLADYLVTKGIPFREAHEIVGRMSATAWKRGNDWRPLPCAPPGVLSRFKPDVAK